jgi:hypothetical protein
MLTCVEWYCLVMGLASDPYSVCRVALQDDSDGLIYLILAWGFDSEEQAISKVRGVASENAVPIEDIAIGRVTLDRILE